MWSEFRFAARGLARWRGGAVTAALTLSLGIGATTGLFALTRVLLADFPGVPGLDRLCRIYASSPSLGVERSQVALQEFDTTLAKATSFAAIGAYAEADAAIGTGDDARAVVAGYASPGFFSALRVTPASGRVFTEADVAANQPVAILGHALWRRQFPDGRIDGATITVDGTERAVIGVMPGEFHYGFVGIGADLWVPIGRVERAAPAIVTVYARLRDNLAWPAAAAELTALSRGRAPWGWRAIPIREDARRRAIGAYAGTLGPAVLVLLIACVNVACMLMARGIARDRELSVRRALGATRVHVVRLLFAENVVLALVSGILGTAIAVAVLRILASALAAEQPALAARLTVDIGLLPVALVSSGLACLLFGTAPALRLSKRDVAASLNGVPSRYRIHIAGYGARDIIVFAEVASAVGLIVWTAMLYTLFAQIERIAFTFPADHVVEMRVPAQRAEDVRTRVAAVRGVTHTAVAAAMPGGGERVRAHAEGEAEVGLSRVAVSDGFFDTISVPLVRGRLFDVSEREGRAGVVVLSERAARQLVPAGEVLGARVHLQGRDGALVVIGVVRDAIDFGMLPASGSMVPSDIYVPYDSTARDTVVLAHVSTDAHAALRAIAAAARTPSGSRPARPSVLGDEMNERRGRGTMVVRFLFAFSLLTLILAASGVFAVISHSVAQRTQEFGIRMALGAAPRRVLGMVLARETKLIGAALGTGVVFSMGLTRALFVELARLSAALPSMWLAALVFSGGVAALAVTLATVRIVRLDPAVVLRRH